MATPNVFNMFATLGAAVKQAGSSDLVKVAFALEGINLYGLADEMEMRRSDLQMEQPIYITTYVKTDGEGVKHDMDDSGYGWKTVQCFDAYVSATPTSGQMKRPAR